MDTQKYLLILTFGLSGCGGGDGGGSSDSGGGTSTTDASQETSQATQAEAAPLRYMNELNVPAEFNYNPVESALLEIDISAITTERAYLSLYSEYNSLGDGAFKADYTSRLSALSLQNGKGSLAFSFPDSQQTVLAEVWFYDGSAPMQKTFNTDQINWVW